MTTDPTIKNQQRQNHPRACGVHELANKVAGVRRGMPPRIRTYHIIYAIALGNPTGNHTALVRFFHQTHPHPDDTAQNDHPRACGTNQHVTRSGAFHLPQYARLRSVIDMMGIDQP